MRKLFCNVVFSLFATCIWSQNTTVLELEAQLDTKEIAADSLVSIYHQLAKLYAKEQKYLPALRITQKEIALLEKEKKQSSQLAAAYFNFASINRLLSNYQVALVYGDKSLNQYQEIYGEYHLECASVQRFLAQTYYLKNDTKNTLIWINKSLVGYSKIKEKYPKEYISLQILLGSLFYQQADYSSAQEAFEKSLAYYEQNKKDISKEILARIYNNLASLKEKKRATSEALVLYQKSEQILVKLNHSNHKSLVTTYSNIGLCYYRLENYDKAIDYHNKNIEILKEIYGEEHTKIARAHTHIGAAFYRQGKWNLSKKHLDKSIRIFQQKLGEESVDMIPALIQLAKVNQEQYDYKSAIHFFEKAARIQQKNYGDFHSNLAKNYSSQAELYYQKEEKKKALQLAEKAQEANKKDGTVLDNALMLVLVIQQLEYTNFEVAAEMQNAFELLAQIPELIDRNQVDLKLTTDLNYLIENIRSVCEKGLKICHYLYQQNKEEKYIQKAFELIEYNKAFLLNLEMKQNLKVENLPIEIQTKYNQLKSEIRQLEYQWQQAEEREDSTFINQIQQQLFEQQKALEQLNESYFAFSPKNSHQPINLNQLKNQLGQEEQVLNYFYGAEDMYCIIIEKEAVFFSQITLNFDSTFSVFFSQLIDLSFSKKNIKKASRKYDIYARELTSKLLPPQLKKQLYILPDGKLNYIPFEALTTQAIANYNGFYGLEYLVKYHAISYAYSATAFYYQQYEYQNKKQARVMGFAPNYEWNKALPNLKYNQEETAFLNELYQGDFYTKEQATRVNFVQNADDYGLIHLAMHGYAEKMAYQDAQLFFTPMENDSLGHILYAHEIMNCQIKADMVALSACQTGIGYWQKGEGVLSLARDFMGVGVPAVLTTLWQVNDNSSSLIIKDFYYQMKTADKSTALQLAKQNYLRQASAFQSHPYFWSGYVLMGNTKPLDLKENTNYGWYFGLGIGAFILAIGIIKGYYE